MTDVERNTPIVLWISPGGLYPVAGGGAARTWAIIEALRTNGYQVHLVTGNQGKHNAALEARVDRLWIRQLNRNAGTPRPLRDRARSWLRHRYMALDPGLRHLYRLNALLGRRVAVEHNTFERNRRRSLEEFAGEVAYRVQPAAAFVSYMWLAPALDRMPPGALRIIDTHDIQHERSAVARTAGGDLSHIVCTREEEARELNRAQVLLGIQEEEAAKLRSLCPDREVILTKHACPVPVYTPSPPESRELLYVGNFYDPNIMGLCTIIEQLWPRIRARCPGATLTVCGKVADSVRRAPEGITLAGRVPDLAPYYGRAAAVINPVPYGTGLKIKTVEALAHGRCAICSPAGAGGLGNPDGLPLIIADPATDMAEEIAALLEAPDRRHAMERRAWEFARDHFSPEAVYGSLLARLQRHGAPPPKTGD